MGGGLTRTHQQEQNFVRSFRFSWSPCFYKYVCRAEQEKEEDSTQEFFNFPASHCHQAKFGGTKMYTKVRGQKYIISQNNGNYLSSLLDIQLQTLGAIR